MKTLEETCSTDSDLQKLPNRLFSAHNSRLHDCKTFKRCSGIIYKKN